MRRLRFSIAINDAVIARALCRVFDPCDRDVYLVAMETLNDLSIRYAATAESILAKLGTLCARISDPRTLPFRGRDE